MKTDKLKAIDNIFNIPENVYITLHETSGISLQVFMYAFIGASIFLFYKYCKEIMKQKNIKQKIAFGFIAGIPTLLISGALYSFGKNIETNFSKDLNSVYRNGDILYLSNQFERKSIPISRTELQKISIERYEEPEEKGKKIISYQTPVCHIIFYSDKGEFTVKAYKQNLSLLNLPTCK